MGGHAFDQPVRDGQPQVSISRLSPQIYTQLRKKVTTTLRQFYEQVLSPPDCPEKADYGDIDILVQDPKGQISVETLKAATGAVRTKSQPPITNLAVPFQDAEGTTRYAQIDVHECKGNIQWLAFMQSYGDLWQILGGIIRPYSLVATDVGLHISIVEGEHLDRKKSRIFLSKDPAHVTNFLGLDWEAYEADFTTVNDIFKWIARCRLFDSKASVSREGSRDDQRRMSSRPMFKRFVEEWLPSNRGVVDDKRPVSRQDVIQEALEAFGKTGEYDERLAEITKQETELKVTKLIVDHLLASGLSKDKANLVVRAIKRWASNTDQGLALLGEPEMDSARQIPLSSIVSEDKSSLSDVSEAWLSSNWEELKTREQRRMKTAKAARLQCSNSDGIGGQGTEAIHGLASSKS